MLSKTGKLTAILAMLVLVSCSLWEYDDPSSPIGNQPPETYLAYVASDTIYRVIDQIVTNTDTVSGEVTVDTTWKFLIANTPDSGSVVSDTLSNAFTTITTSQQLMSWWGEDLDGEVVSYEVRWNSDPGWTGTVSEDSLFSVPIRVDLDVFQFYVRAVDDSGLVDPSPAMLTFPIRNSQPEIEFRYNSNPFRADHGGTAYTFGTRTFTWDVTDLDGLETITDIFYALDDTCDTCWTQLDANLHSSWTLTDIEPGEHVFYLKARDIAGAESEKIQFPDSTRIDECQRWIVKPVTGNILLVNDFPDDSDNAAETWYSEVLETIAGDSSFSTWRTGYSLPYSPTDVIRTLSYFDHVIWFSAYIGAENYLDASSSIEDFVKSGGNFFLNVSEIKDTSLVFFPLLNQTVINPSGRFFPGRKLISQVDGLTDLESSYTIGVRMRSFIPDTSTSTVHYDLFHLDEPSTGDSWVGTPNVCSLRQYEIPAQGMSGKLVFMTMPLHNGSTPLLEGGGNSASQFLEYMLTQEFGYEN